MRYEIKGGMMPVVEIILEAGESINCEKGAMVWMSPNMQMQTSGGGVGKMFTRAISGESRFRNTYTAQVEKQLASIHKAGRRLMYL